MRPRAFGFSASPLKQVYECCRSLCEVSVSLCHQVIRDSGRAGDGPISAYRASGLHRVHGPDRQRPDLAKGAWEKSSKGTLAPKGFRVETSCVKNIYLIDLKHLI